MVSSQVYDNGNDDINREAENLTEAEPRVLSDDSSQRDDGNWMWLGPTHASSFLYINSKHENTPRIVNYFCDLFVFPWWKLASCPSFAYVVHNHNPFGQEK